MHYTAIAYRWGFLNSDHYHVCVTADADEATTLAEEECNSRGGKYGVQVLEWTTGTDYRAYAYFPSSYGESEPHVNQRTELFRDIGARAHEVVTRHTLWKPGPDNRMVAVATVPPTWLVEVFREKEKFRRLMAALVDDAKAQVGQPERSDADKKQWLEQLQVSIDRELDEVLAQAAAHAPAGATADDSAALTEAIAALRAENERLHGQNEALLRAKHAAERNERELWEQVQGAAHGAKEPTKR